MRARARWFVAARGCAWRGWLIGRGRGRGAAAAAAGHGVRRAAPQRTGGVAEWQSGGVAEWRKRDHGRRTRRGSGAPAWRREAGASDRRRRLHFPPYPPYALPPPPLRSRRGAWAQRCGRRAETSSPASPRTLQHGTARHGGVRYSAVRILRGGARARVVSRARIRAAAAALSASRARGGAFPRSGGRGGVRQMRPVAATTNQAGRAGGGGDAARSPCTCPCGAVRRRSCRTACWTARHRSGQQDALSSTAAANGDLRYISRGQAGERRSARAGSCVRPSAGRGGVLLLLRYGTLKG